MKRIIEWKTGILVCWVLAVVTCLGDEIWMAKDCWRNRQDAPRMKLSDLGVGGFMAHVRVASLNPQLEARLVLVQPRMDTKSIPEDTILLKEKIPVTLAEAAEYLNRNVCMAFPPVLCVETADAFFFSGGRSTKPVYDFSCGMAVTKADGAIWTWDQVEEAP